MRLQSDTTTMKTYPNCKINLGLHVMRKRDDGYHDLETIFVPVSLHDELDISPANTFSFLQDGIAIDGNPDSNLVVRAYHLLQQHSGSRLGNVEIRLTKKIPTGAGLGGGSSDAAFTLVMLNKIFNLGIQIKTLQSLAAKLGADCAFFIENIAAFATGIGDQLSPPPLNPLLNYKLLLVKPDEFVSTYAKLSTTIFTSGKTPLSTTSKTASSQNTPASKKSRANYMTPELSMPP